MTWEKVFLSVPHVRLNAMFLRMSVCEKELWRSLDILTKLSRNIVIFADKF